MSDRGSFAGNGGGGPGVEVFQATEAEGLEVGVSEGGYVQSGGGQQGGPGRGPTGAGAPGDRIFGSPAPVDKRLQISDALVQVLKKLPYKPERPHCPGFGTLGIPITVGANFFAVKFKKQLIYDYAVEITPDKFPKQERARLFTLLEQSEHPQWREFVPFIAHDKSARLISAKELPRSLEVPVVFTEEGETRPSSPQDTYTFKFELKHKLNNRELDRFLNGKRSPRDYDLSLVMAAYNLVLQSHASHNGVRIGSKGDVGGDYNMAVVPARKLPLPEVNYAAGRRLNVKDGSWNILDVEFYQGVTVKSWCVLVVLDGRPAFDGNPNDQALTSVWQGFAEKCRRSGMKVEKDPKVLFTPQLPPQAEDPNRQRALDMIRQTIVESNSPCEKPSFILVLLSGRDNFIYPGIKRLCDVDLGVHTLHMLIEKVLRDQPKQDQYFSNVALKLNIKLGGINHLLDPASTKWLTREKTMVLGMDVTHPSPGSLEGTPSIAAVVGSVDDRFVQFPASLRCQESMKEMITDLAEVIAERLHQYRQVSKTLPDRVFVYRSGVSESQFDKVLEEELPGILDAFRRVPSDANQGKLYRPALTIIICGKRHHMRFFPDRPEFADRNGNTRPGTVVDKGITSVSDFDFYLQAHAGLPGQVKGTRYTVVYDENKLGADEVQQGLNTASYLYARATQAVSLVPAAYYADLACKRGRCYLNEFLKADDKSSTLVSRGSGHSRQAKEEAKRKVYNDAVKAWAAGVHPDLKNSMFYI